MSIPPLFGMLGALGSCVQELWSRQKFYLLRYPGYRLRPTRLFDHINIQTNSSCTRRCPFCAFGQPDWAARVESMPSALFSKIIDELAELDFVGRVSLYEINEPLTDPSIFDRVAEAKRKLPRAFHFMISNGDLLDEQSGERLFAVGLDELRLSCYSRADAERHTALALRLLRRGRRVRLIRNDGAQTWTSRGGNIKRYYKGAVRAPCELVFKQMIVKPTGLVTLCVNDLHQQHTVGDLGRQSLREVWFGAAFESVRRRLLDSDRSVTPLCSGCDYVGHGGYVRDTR